MGRDRPGLLLVHNDDGTNDQIALRHDVTTLGRSGSCTVVFGYPTVSRVHARIELQNDRYMLCDNGSVNGTFVNGTRITVAYQLKTGDVIQLGSPDVTCSFLDPEETMAIRLDASAPLLIDEQARTVQVYGTMASLSPLEFDLLSYLAHNQGTVRTREQCFLHVWGQPYDHATCEDALNACVTKLRRNLRRAAAATDHEPPRITTLLRIGLRLDDPVTWAGERAPAAASVTSQEP